MGTLRAIWPLGPIFGKELRQMARRKRSYILRFCYLGVLLATLTFTWLIFRDSYSYYGSGIAVQAQRQGEMGQVFFGVFAMFSVIAMHFTGPILTSTAIGSERLRRTFDTLLMTPISAWQLVTGKLFSRLLTAAVLIGLSLPVLAIVRLLGGVELEDMFGALGLALAVAASTASMGLLLSCWIKRAWAVILLSYIILGVLYFVVPLIVGALVAATMRHDTTPYDMRWFLAIAASLHPVMTTGVKITPGVGLLMPVTWWAAIGVQCAIATGLTTLASIVVRRIGRKQGEGDTRAVTSPLLAPVPPAIPTADSVLPPTIDSSGSRPPVLPYVSAQVASARRARDGSVGDRPVLWREIRQPLLPRRWQRITATSVTLALLLLSYLAVGANNELDDIDSQYAYIFIMHTLLGLMAVVLSATAIATEKESDTWTLLIVTPISGNAVVWGKTLGVLRRMRWPFALAVGHVLLFTIGGVYSVSSAAMVLWVMLTFSLPLIATGLFFSLTMRGVTTAVVLNLLVPVAIYAIVPLALAAIEAGLAPQYPSIYRNLPELMLYYLPYYYLGPFLEDTTRRVGTASVPYFGGRVPAEQMLITCYVIGALHIGVAAAILSLCAARFDAIAKRARS